MSALQNILIFAGATLVVVACSLFWRSERWQRARLRFQKDLVGILSLAVIVLYALIGLMDSVELPARAGDGKRLTLIEYAFHLTPKERGYSAPGARTTFAINRPEPLKGTHWLGTDVLGRDVLLQTLRACRTALIIGGLTSFIYIPLGTLFGIIAGYYKRWVDDVIQYVYSTLACVPGILLLIAIIMVLENVNIRLWNGDVIQIPRLVQMSLALGITSWVGLCRLIRGDTLRQVERPYVEAARALGQSNWNIITRHILPNVMHLVLINFVLGFSGLVMSEAILSYIGIGAPVGTASWGTMIDSARMELAREPAVWWSFAAASTALFFLVLSLNLLGASLRRAFDPRAG